MDNRKLHILFLSVLSSMKEDETNCQIASYILEHLDEVKNMSIVELAKSCFVSNSSISRFCRDMGLHDFTELKELLKNSERSYHVIGDSSDRKQNAALYIDAVKKGIEQIEQKLDYEVLDRIVDDLIRYKKVAAFGLLNAEPVAMSLQNDMMLLGKMITTKISYQQQTAYLKKTDTDDLILIFSSHGLYFNSHFHQKVLKKINKPKIILVTGNPHIKKDCSIDEVLYYPLVQDEASRPFQLQLIEGLIVQNYAMRIKEEKSTVS